ncbi:MAG: CoA-binding protein [Deltaproteobacteria bacterium]|nr:CoA-binding protein [Deltaproteobacteria bacterium]
MSDIKQQIDTFLKSSSFAVVGASQNRAKYGNKVLRVYMQNNLKVYPINPKEDSIEGLTCLKEISELPADTQSISVITPPAVTEKVVEAAHKKGIKNIWMQPGAESTRAINLCKEFNINCIADGSCALVVLRYKESK